MSSSTTNGPCVPSLSYAAAVPQRNPNLDGRLGFVRSLWARIAWICWRWMEDDRREEQQNSRSQKGAADHEESEKCDGMNPLQADRFNAQAYDQQEAGEPERHGEFTSTGVHS